MRRRRHSAGVFWDLAKLAMVLSLAALPVFAFAVFSAGDYEAMKLDSSRTNAFYKAIDDLCPDRVVLDLGTGATALLAIRAAQAGAKRVYAVEVSESSAQRAAESIEAAGFSSKVSLLLGDSKELNLPEPVDVIVHEILGEIASREGVVPSLSDARQRHLRSVEGAWSIPAKATTWIAPAAMPSSEYFAAYRAQSGALLLAPGRGERFLRLPQLPVESCQLAEAQAFEELTWYEDIEPPLQQRRLLRFAIGAAGTLAGFVFYITVDCGGDSAIVSSACAQSHWANPFCRVAEPVAVSSGDEVLVNTEVDLSGAAARYAVVAWLSRPGHAKELLLPRTEFT
ncbi:PRMT6 [Symbiodinium sp. CCMP2592]|nr:PRMT6 [Symbiodinium sp. CCMP2592]